MIYGEEKYGGSHLVEKSKLQQSREEIVWCINGRVSRLARNGIPALTDDVNIEHVIMNNIIQKIIPLISSLGDFSCPYGKESRVGPSIITYCPDSVLAQ